MNDAKGFLSAIKALSVVCLHPHEDLLKILTDLLEAGLEYHLILTHYENECGDSAAQRIRGDVGQVQLYKISKVRANVLALMEKFQNYKDNNMPENLPDDVDDITDAGLKLLKLDYQLSWQLDRESVVDSIQLLASGYKERIASGHRRLRELAGAVGSPEDSWHNQVPEQASWRQVLETGAAY